MVMEKNKLKNCFVSLWLCCKKAERLYVEGMPAIHISLVIVTT